MNNILGTIRTTEDAQTVNKIMAINRFVVVAAVFFFASLTWALGIIRFDPLVALFYVLPAIVILNGIWLWYCRTKEIKQFYFLPQVLADTGLILAAVYFSGGLYSDFLFLPLIVLSLAALISRRLSLAAFALSAVFYFIIFFDQMTGLSFQEVIYSLGGLNGMKLIRILAFGFIGVLISFVVSYFVDEIRRRNKEMEELEKNMYASMVRSLCDSLIAIHWLMEEFDNAEFLGSHREFAENIKALREFKESAFSKIKELLAVVDNDFLSAEEMARLTKIAPLIKK